MAYTSHNTRSYEEYVREKFDEAVQKADICPMTPIFADNTPISLHCICYFLRPVGRRKGKKRREMPVVKPDWDNCGKIISDALNGYAYHDDDQIVNAQIYKRYTEDIREVGVSVVIEEVA